MTKLLFIALLFCCFLEITFFVVGTLLFSIKICSNSFLHTIFILLQFTWFSVYLIAAFPIGKSQTHLQENWSLIMIVTFFLNLLN